MPGWPWRNRSALPQLMNPTVNVNPMNNSYPEINGLNLSEVRLAIKLGVANLDAVMPEFKPELERRLEALRDRKARLLATGKRIAAIQKAR